MSGYAEPQAYDTNGAMAQFDAELDRLETSLDAITATVRPVMNLYDSAEAKLANPRPEPPTELHARIARLSDLTDRAYRIRDEIRL